MTTERDSTPAAAGEGEDLATAAEAPVGSSEPLEPVVVELDDSAEPVVDPRVASLEAQLDLAQEKARETFVRLKDEHERHLRAAADLENYRRRAAREREEAQKFGTERLLKDLLPVMDNLDRALATAADGDPLAGGVRMIRKIFEEALGKHAVEVFSALGGKFDPRVHEALATHDAPGATPGCVVAEHGRGFLLHGRLLRPALVVVAAAPRDAEPRGEDES